jgi:hypothetical protein
MRPGAQQVDVPALDAFEALLQRRDVGRHLFSGLSADDERNNELADAVTLEVDSDCQAGSMAIRGSTVTSTTARIGPSMPRTPRVLGGSMCMTSDVL